MLKFFAKFFTKHLFKWVSEEDVLTFTKDGILHRGKLLNKDQVYQLSEQARIIRQMYLWKLLSDEIRYVAYLHWVKTGEDLSSRLLMRAEEIIRKRLKALEDLAVEKQLE